MARLPKPTRNFRFDARHLCIADTAADVAEVNLSEEARAWLAWWIREPGARLPRRPAADVIAAARADDQSIAS